MYISNKQTPVAPAWKKLGSQYKVGSTGIQKKNDFAYSPSTSLLGNKPVAPAMFTGSKPQQGPVQPAPQVSQGNSAPSFATASAAPEQVNSMTANSTPMATAPSAPLAPKRQLNGGKGLVQPKVNPLSFGGVVGGLVGRSSASREQERYLQQVEKAAQAGKQIAADARNTSKVYGDEIARVGKLGAGAVAGNLSTGSNVVGSGNANLAAESASNRMNALSTGLTAELQGTQQQLTAADQGITGMTNALTGANTQQSNSINALSQAGSLAQPNPAQYGQTVFDPLSGGYSGGNLDPQQQATNLAQQVMSGAMTYDQAIASLGYAGAAGSNFLNNAITGAGGNPLQLQAQNAASQANIATQGTAGTEIARQGLGTATQDYVALNTAAQFANQQADAVSGILEQTGLNNVSSTDYNKALNNLKGRFSDQNFASLNTALQEAQIAYTNLLSTGGGTPTGREDAALNTLNINQSAAAINASIRELEGAVARRLQAQYSAVQQYNQNLGSGVPSGGGGAGGGQWDW